MKYIRLSIIGIIYTYFHIYLTNIVQHTGSEFYNNHIENHKIVPKVYDIMHKYIPYWEDNLGIGNLICVISLVPLFYVNNKQLYFDFTALLLIINFIRDITINITILPKDELCDNNNIHYSLYSITGGCYDKIFSGHFAFILLLSLLYNSYKVIKNIPILVLWNMSNAFIILKIRSHYTIDILVSLFICVSVYNEYIKHEFTFKKLLEIL
jgi:hypothetical protein